MVSLVAVPPATGAVQIEPRFFIPGSQRANATRLPSGDQVGLKSIAVPVVTWRRPVPFAFITQMSVRLANAIRSELARGLELRMGGASNPEVYRVHDRLDEPCPNCRTPIARVDFEEHTIYYCPTCQTGGRILADRRLSRLLR